MTRRNLIAATACIAAAVVSRPALLYAQANAPATPTPTPPGPFKLDPLLYPTNALAPSIDAKTMEIHHDRHHLAYVSGLNADELAQLHDLLLRGLGVADRTGSALTG